jgi:hypothetical protein
MIVSKVWCVSLSYVAILDSGQSSKHKVLNVIHHHHCTLLSLQMFCYIFFSCLEPRTESLVPKPSPATSQQTKDDAYMQFMREMEGLL